MLELERRVTETGPTSDAELLARWSAKNDADALELLVRRHGAMVHGVCRRVLQSAADTDDAFQAVFLIFVRKARSLTDPARLAGWLHGVAVRVARKALADRVRRNGRETTMVETPAPPSAEDTGELRRVLDEELNRLPEKYRLPIILCELQGLTLEAAARRLDWPKGTVAGRLSRGRERLRHRLSRRWGLGLPLFLLGWGSASTGNAAVPGTLLAKTVAATSGPGGPPPRPAALADAVLREGSRRLGRLTVLILAIGLLAVISWEVRAAAVTDSGSTSGSTAQAIPTAVTSGGCHATP